MFLWTRENGSKSGKTWQLVLTIASLASGIICLLWAFETITLRNSDDDDWVKYPAPHSKGPLHQRRLVSANVTSWLARSDPSDFVLRLDDGSLMPAALVSEREKKWQNWFETRYPQFAEYRDTGKHIDAENLAQVESGEQWLVADSLFHVAHCVAAFRRYVDATVSKKHICPRDLDIHHLDHCLQSLEEYMFKGGEIGSFHRQWYTDSKAIAPVINISFHDESQVRPGYWLMAPLYDSEPTTSPVVPMAPYILDTNGDLVWTGAMKRRWGPTYDFRFEGGVLSFAAGGSRRSNLLGKCLPYFLDDSLELTESLDLHDPLQWLNGHELHAVPGGESIIVQDRVSHTSLQQDGFSILEDRFFEISRSTGDILFEWHSLEHIPVTESHLAAIPEILPQYGGDLFHMNSIEKTEFGDYLVSARHASAIYIVSGTTGEIVWRLGGSRSSFHLNGFNFSAQHDARYHGRDTLNRTIVSFLDNASTSGFANTSTTSSALIVALDENTGTANLVQRFWRPDGGISIGRGNVQLLENGNVFVCWSFGGYMSEFSETGDLISEIRFSDPKMGTYRAYKYDVETFRHITAQEDPSVVWEAIEEDDAPSWTVTAYASWNGGFALDNWQLLGCSSYVAANNSCNTEWSVMAEAPRTGFETQLETTVSERPEAIIAHALDQNHVSLRASQPISLEDSKALQSSGAIFSPGQPPAALDNQFSAIISAAGDSSVTALDRMRGGLFLLMALVPVVVVVVAMLMLPSARHRLKSKNLGYESMHKDTEDQR